MSERPGRLLDTLDLCGLTGETWSAWQAVAKCLDGEGEQLTPDERRVFEECTGRTSPPTEPPAEFFAICGRRSGKSRFAGTCAVRAASRRYRLAPGEQAVVGLAAADREQARGLLGYATAPFREAEALRPLVRARSPWTALRDLVSRETRWGVDLATGVSIEVRTSHFGKIRGRTYALAVADELAFWSAEDGSNPASEVLTAIRPGLVTLGGQLVGLSSPFAKNGPLWDVFSKYYGKDDDRVLVWRAASRVMNATIPERVVLDALERDESAARAEWLAEFRSDLESFVSSESIAHVVVRGRTELPPRPDEGDYLAFTDPAGGSGADSFTLAICHAEQDDEAGQIVVVLDLVREARPPFSPSGVVAEFAGILRAYGCTRVTGDRFGGEWPREGFRRHDIEYVVADRTRSEFYRDVLPLINAGEVELLDHPKLLAQLGALERRVGFGGRDAIDHGSRGHDDLVNAAAGALVLASAEVSRPEMRISVL